MYNETTPDGAGSPEVSHAEASSPRAEEALRQALLDALPAQVLLLDARGHISAVNAAWRRFADENGGDAGLRMGIGLDYLGVCHAVTGENAEQAQLVAEGVAAVLERRQSQFIHEYPCHGPDCWRWMALSATPLDDASRGALLVHLDITERKLAERDARLARESMARAARLNAVGILAASLLHELSQPLSAASFFSGTAVSLLNQDTTRLDRLADVLSRIEDQIRRASATLERLREFLRHQTMRLEPIAVDRLAERALEWLRWLAADRNVRLTYSACTPDLHIMADAVQLEQVLVNLVSNSIQAMDAAGMGRREVHIAVTRIEPRGQAAPTSLASGDAARLGHTAPHDALPTAGMTQITISDTGPGLPLANAEQLFNIFTSTRGSGLGLGLAISRDIVEAHGGRLWADTRPPEGARLHFTIPSADDGGA